MGCSGCGKKTIKSTPSLNTVLKNANGNTTKTIKKEVIINGVKFTTKSNG